MSCPPATQDKRLCVNNINGCTQPARMKPGLLLISLQGFRVRGLFVYSGGQVVPGSVKYWKTDQSFFFLLILNMRKRGNNPEMILCRASLQSAGGGDTAINTMMKL